MPETQPVGETPRVPVPPRDELDAFAKDESLQSPATLPIREGLPRGYRMRADSHYVEQLDAHMPTMTVRLIETHAIDSGQPHADTLSPAFVESIKKHGILQPLLVESRGLRYRVIAGRRRLAGAIAAGLREVPCLLQRYDAEQAELVALATNVPPTRQRSIVAPEPVSPTADAATRELGEVLSSLISCASLLANGSALTQAVAPDLVRAEARRALDLLTAVRVLRNEMALSRRRVSVRSLIERVSQTFHASHPLRLIDLQIDSGGLDGVSIMGDEIVLAAAIGGLLSTTGDLAGDAPDGAISLHVSSDVPGQVAFAIAQRHLAVPPPWVSHAFDSAWPTRYGQLALVLLQSARKIARAHAGDVSMDAIDGGTSVTVMLPYQAADEK